MASTPKPMPIAIGRVLNAINTIAISAPKLGDVERVARGHRDCEPRALQLVDDRGKNGTCGELSRSIQMQRALAFIHDSPSMSWRGTHALDPC